MFRKVATAFTASLELSRFQSITLPSIVNGKLVLASFVVASFALISPVVIAAEEKDMRFSQIESFNDFLEWIEEEIDQLKNKGKSKVDANNDIVIDLEPILQETSLLPDAQELVPNTEREAEKTPVFRGPLDLSLPEEAFDDSANFHLSERQRLNMPDLFSHGQNGVHSEESATSFGGRLLMDENFETLEQYRIEDITNSIRGAEMTFEVKTN